MFFFCRKKSTSTTQNRSIIVKKIKNAYFLIIFCFIINKIKFNEVNTCDFFTRKYHLVANHHKGMKIHLTYHSILYNLFYQLKSRHFYFVLWQSAVCYSIFFFHVFKIQYLLDWFKLLLILTTTTAVCNKN